jgi:hypothetical protein
VAEPWTPVRLGARHFAFHALDVPHFLTRTRGDMNYLRQLVAITVIGTSAAAQSIPFDAGWQLRGDSARIEQFDGRSTFTTQSGFAFRRDVRFMDGTIDLDVMSTERRSFVYVMFRMQSDSTFEDFYLRPHKSNAPDAMQYAPVYQASSAWQLYHGTGVNAGTAAVEIPDGKWNHLRIVVRGRQAAFFLNDTIKPALVVNRLGHVPSAGYLALRGFLPAGVPGSGAIARFSNVRVRPDYFPYAFAPTAEPVVPGVVRSWLVGNPVTATDSTPLQAHADVVPGRRRAEALPNGLLELHRVVPLRNGMRDVATVAGIVVHADSASTWPLELGFSDQVVALVNGRPLFQGNASYDYANRRDGLIGFDQARLFLPLRAGRNTIDFVVRDVFGGWGIMARFPSMAGIRFVEE